jgi:hypothetical protein
MRDPSDAVPDERFAGFPERSFEGDRFHRSRLVDHGSGREVLRVSGSHRKALRKHCAERLRCGRCLTNVHGYCPCKRPDGNHQLLTLVGADPGAGTYFPLPYLSPDQAALNPEALLVDRSNTELVQAGRLPLEVELNRQRAHVTGQTSGFSTFLGSPTPLRRMRTPVRYIGLNPEDDLSPCPLDSRSACR